MKLRSSTCYVLLQAPFRAWPNFVLELERGILFWDLGFPMIEQHLTKKKSQFFTWDHTPWYIMFVSALPSIPQTSTSCIKDQHMPFDHKPQRAQFCPGLNQGWRADALKICEHGMLRACILIQSKLIRPFKQPLSNPVYTTLTETFVSSFPWQSDEAN